MNSDGSATFINRPGVIDERGTGADGDGYNIGFERLTGTNPRNGEVFRTMGFTVTGGTVLLDFTMPSIAAVLIDSSAFCSTGRCGRSPDEIRSSLRPPVPANTAPPF